MQNHDLTHCVGDRCGRPTLSSRIAIVSDTRKDAERGYPARVSLEGRRWLETKPFGHDPRHTARHLIDFGYVVQLLELGAGTRLCELGCGPGWMTVLAARQGADAVGYDISPEMIEIARARASGEEVQARFEVGDMETLDLGRGFDACLLYEALHHSTRPDLVVRTAHRALRPRGLLLIAEPNWKQRYQGVGASRRYGTTELGYTPRRLKRILRETGFGEVRRFHNNRKRLYSNAPLDVLSHVAEPLVYRALAPFWTQIWLRARAR
jgi:2-polyprenyl-3-methyl-5-hydroxy-6-metoxy-1,4-benzoquinol methylase